MMRSKVASGGKCQQTPPKWSKRVPDAGRRALYYKFAEPKTFDWVPAGCHYNDALFRADPEGRVANRAAAGSVSNAYPDANAASRAD